MKCQLPTICTTETWEKKYKLESTTGKNTEVCISAASHDVLLNKYELKRACREVKIQYTNEFANTAAHSRSVLKFIRNVWSPSSTDYFVVSDGQNSGYCLKQNLRHPINRCDSEALGTRTYCLHHCKEKRRYTVKRIENEAGRRCEERKQTCC